MYNTDMDSKTEQSPAQPQQLTPKTSPKDIVLQWLSYCLWSWSLITIATLLSSSLTYFLVSGSRENGSYEWQLYFIAAMVCLVPAAFFVDRFFSKTEQPRKHGFAAVVMVLNAVFVFLFALGSSIGFVIGLMQLVLKPGDTTTTQVVIISTFVTAVLTFAFFFRILNLEKLKIFPTVFRYVMLGVSLLAIILTFSGPFVRELSLKDDRLIEENLSRVNRLVQDYARSNNKLPESLDQLQPTNSYEQGARTLIESGLVRYERETSGTVSVTRSSRSSSTTDNLANLSALKYQLCVTYKASKSSSYSDYDTYDTYTSYLSTYSHPKGEVCYKLTAGY